MSNEVPCDYAGGGGGIIGLKDKLGDEAAGPQFVPGDRGLLSGGRQGLADVFAQHIGFQIHEIAGAQARQSRIRPRVRNDVHGKNAFAG